jgi:hypothetical protein
MGRKKSEKLIDRNRELMVYYDELLRSYGPDMVRRISKTSIYEEVGDKFHISGDRARVIISKELKKVKQKEVAV